MSAPDFYFAINSNFRHIHDQYGKDALIAYWRALGRDFFAGRVRRWSEGGVDAVAEDWRGYFAKEPNADVSVHVEPTPIPGTRRVRLEVRTCPAIKHLRDNQREIVPYFCEHCDHVAGASAEAAGFVHTRVGGMGCCEQVFATAGRDAGG